MFNPRYSHHPKASPHLLLITPSSLFPRAASTKHPLSPSLAFPFSREGWDLGAYTCGQTPCYWAKSLLASLWQDLSQLGWPRTHSATQAGLELASSGLGHLCSFCSLFLSIMLGRAFHTVGFIKFVDFCVLLLPFSMLSRFMHCVGCENFVPVPVK